MRRMLLPGNADPTRYMSVPQLEQKWLVMVWPDGGEPTVLDCPKDFRLSLPRRCCRCSSAMMKLEANIEAVILRQSAQLQRKVPTRPGPSVGWAGVLDVRMIASERRRMMGEMLGAVRFLE